MGCLARHPRFLKPLRPSDLSVAKTGSAPRRRVQSLLLGWNQQRDAGVAGSHCNGAGRETVRMLSWAAADPSRATLRLMPLALAHFHLSRSRKKQIPPLP